jgi:diacylglycerol O-acyltransferase
MATATQLTVPRTLTRELVERLARLSGQPEGVAEVALSAVPYGSLSSLIAHGIIAPVDDEKIDAAVELVITPYGRQIIDACARLVKPHEASRSAPTPRAGIAVSKLDARFLGQDGMEVGAVATFVGSSPTYSQVLEYIRARLDRVPRYRHKLAAPLIGPQRWVDDPAFNLEYHVRYAALPSPGGMTELQKLVGRIFSQRLDRSKPLWEVFLVAGLKNKRFAVISKTHLAMVDGISGFDLMTTLFDVSKKPPEVYSDLQWDPQSEPSSAELTFASLNDAIHHTAKLSRRVIASTVEDPLGTATQIERALVQTLTRKLSAVLKPRPTSPLDMGLSPHRRVEFVDMPLADFKAVKNAFGATVNDVVLAVIAGGLRTWMESRDLRPDNTELRAALPLSTAGRDGGSRGPGITQMVAPLPVNMADPVKRLHHVRNVLRGIKESRKALAADVIADMAYFASPTILAQASRLHFSKRLCDLVVANVPGPPMPLYVLGRRMETIYPVAPLTGERAIAIAVMSYNNDRIYFSVIADRLALPDIHVVVDGITWALQELVDLSASASALESAATPNPTRPFARSGAARDRALR